MRLAVLRLRVAAAFLAAALRCVAVRVAIDGLLESRFSSTWLTHRIKTQTHVRVTFATMRAEAAVFHVDPIGAARSSGGVGHHRACRTGAGVRGCLSRLDARGGSVGRPVGEEQKAGVIAAFNGVDRRNVGQAAVAAQPYRMTSASRAKTEDPRDSVTFPEAGRLYIEG